MRSGASRRLRLAAVGIVAASLALAGCGNTSANPSGDGGDAGEQVTLRFLWWGNDTRNEVTNEVIEKFEAAHPNITIETDTSDWNGYWQKLSTQVAGGDAPDVIQMDETYLSEYSSKGALADLEQIGIDTADWADGTVDAGRYDGTLTAATFAINSPVFIANPSLFEQAGVDLPDDTTWTWDDFADLAVELQSASDGAFYGAQNLAGQNDAAKIWIRQQGGEQFTADGLGFDDAEMSSWFSFWKDLQDNGGTAPATASIQDQTTAVDQSLSGTNKNALFFQWSNQVNAVQNATGQDLVLLRPPTQDGSAADGKLWYKSSMYLSVAANTEHPEEVKTFIDYILNDPEAGAILGTERGIPVNTQVRDAITPDLDAANAKVVEFMDSISAELGTAPAAPLPGGGQIGDVQRRASDPVLLGDLDADTAAQQFVTELTSALTVG